MNREVKCFQFACDECKKQALVVDPTYGFQRPPGWGETAAAMRIVDGIKTWIKNQDYCDVCYPKWLEKQQIRETFS